MTAKELKERFENADWDERRDICKKYIRFGKLLGKTIVDIYGAFADSQVIAIITDDGTKYIMYHEQDCCETVAVEDICGDVNCLIGNPLLKAEEVTDEHDTEWGHQTYTFYHLATVRGYVTIRWVGDSNGYYSESVDLVEVV